MAINELLQTQVIQKAWEDPEFRERLLHDPKAVIQEMLGIQLPEHIQLKTLEETPDQIYLVLPPNPSGVLSAVRPQARW